MSEYKQVWVDKLGAIRAEPNGAYPPYVEHRVVPADAIVIEDALPTVKVERGRVRTKSFLGEVEAQVVTASFDYGEQGHTETVPGGFSPDEFIALGLALKAHPSVDAAMVEALAASIRDIRGDGTFGADGIARRLIEQGWSKPEVGR